MRAEEILQHVRRQPFRPFCVFVSEGATYDVRHPELIFVTRRDVIIALDEGDGEVPERSAYLDPVHITRIEPVNGRRKRSRKGKAR